MRMGRAITLAYFIEVLEIVYGYGIMIIVKLRIVYILTEEMSRGLVFPIIKMVLKEHTDSGT